MDVDPVDFDTRAGATGRGRGGNPSRVFVREPRPDGRDSGTAAPAPVCPGLLKQEWTRYLEQTRNHERILREVCRKLSINPGEMTPGREVTRYLGTSMVSAMELAHATGTPSDAERVACDCVTAAEMRDHANWQLLDKCAQHSSGEQQQVLAAAVGEVEEEEVEHFYHARGWARELWLQALGLEAVLPPPEEREQVTTPIGAARVEHRRDSMTEGHS
jgi:hypothetical protein